MAVDPDPAREDTLKPAEDGASLKRLVFNHATVESAVAVPVELSRASPSSFSPLTLTTALRSAGDILRLDYGVDTFPMLFMQKNLGPGVEGHDIRSDEGASRAVDRITGLSPLPGWSSPSIKAVREN